MSTADAAHSADTHGGFAIGRRVMAGVVGGIAGGLVFGILMMMMGMLPTIVSTAWINRTGASYPSYFTAPDIEAEDLVALGGKLARS